MQYIKKTRLFFENGRCHHDIDIKTAIPNFELSSPMQDCEIFIIAQLKYEMLTNDDIISRIKQTYQLIKSIDVELASFSDYDPDYFERYILKSPNAKNEVNNLLSVKARYYYELQNLTNRFAINHGATLEDIVAISYYDHNMHALLNSLDDCLKQYKIEDINALPITDGVAFIYHMKESISNYLTTQGNKSRFSWKKLLKGHKIPQYGFCNALMEYNLLELFDIIKKKYAYEQRITIANKIQGLIDVFISDGQKKIRFQTRLCHAMLATYLCGYIYSMKELRAKLEVICHCSIDSSHWSKTIIAFYHQLKKTENPKYNPQQNKGIKIKNYYLQQMEDDLGPIIDNEYDNIIKELIPKNSYCHNYYNDLIALKESFRG